MVKGIIFRTFSWLSGVFFLISLVACNQRTKLEKDYPIQPVPFTQVKITDNFWARRLEINRTVTIPIAFKKAEETGRIDNFKIAGGLKAGKFASLYPFDDSDVYKNIEAASYSILVHPDPELEAYLDTLISYIAAAQEDDGYLYTNRTIDPDHPHEMAGRERWVNEEASSHELYNAGHLYEAAVAHYQATGKRSLLDVALKNADLVNRTFGWGKLEKAPGHQEIEIGLVKLYRVTGDTRYLDLAKFFLDVRGPRKDPYNQMHKKVVDQDSAVGHAVRAQYMYSAMADIAALTSDKTYLDAINKLWKDVTESKTYITGGIGAAGDIEGFGAPYDLPNSEAYCETCASIANAFWNYRMFLLHGDSRYYDVFEKVLYNGLLSGVSQSGDHFFYPNPLSSDGQYVRKEWFGCACCPVNITRFLPSLPGYIYAVEKNSLYVNLFIGNEADVNIDGNLLHISQVTDYPWDGKVKIEVHTNDPVSFKMRIRVPGWSVNKAFPTDLYSFTDKSKKVPEFYINGTRINAKVEKGYAHLEKSWNDGDVVEVDFSVTPRLVKANERVIEDIGEYALQMGPVIYCVESVDQPDKDPFKMSFGRESDLAFSYEPSLLNGIGELKGDVVAIPYYAWANREQGWMRVWLPVLQPH